jgi:hypothetical protein
MIIKNKLKKKNKYILLMTLKKIGYYIVKGKCVKVYAMEKRNRSGRLVRKKVNYKGKVLKKGTKVYKTKLECVKALKRKMNKGKKSVKKLKSHSSRSKRSKHSKFGNKSQCEYAVPYFGNMIPSVAKTWSGTQDTGITSSLWKWPAPPSAKAYDMQQGGWGKVKNISHSY